MEMGGYFQSLAVIAILLGALVLVLWGIRKYGTRLGLTGVTGARPLSLEAHISLGPKRGACVVRYNNQKFLLGVTDHHITLLSRLENEPQRRPEHDGNTGQTIPAG